MLKKLNIVNGIIQDKEIDGIPVVVNIIQGKGLRNVRTFILIKKLIGITNHNTGNANADDSDHAKWLQNVENADKLYVSPHICIDSDSITQLIPLNEVGYHAGDGKGDGNMKTIGVEICEDRELEKAEANAIKFNAAMLMTYPDLKIFKHQDWNGKYCPHIILKRNGWDKFVRDIKEASLGTVPKPKPTKPQIKPAVLKKGSKGDAVKLVQLALTRLGYPVTADGDFGALTEAAVIKLQKANKLTADGIVGPATQKVLDR